MQKSGTVLQMKIAMPTKKPKPHTSANPKPKPKREPNSICNSEPVNVPNRYSHMLKCTCVKSKSPKSPSH